MKFLLKNKKLKSLFFLIQDKKLASHPQGNAYLSMINKHVLTLNEGKLVICEPSMQFLTIIFR